MDSSQDARPFVDLQKDAEEFRSKFDDDIQKCISFLDLKITALMCDPDSLGTPSKGVKQNALVEFSKAKYDIFISVKSLINEMEREWMKYISEMKKLFIENVEIFLAGTKLEVKLPSNEFQSSPSFKKSPHKMNATSSIASSLYPLINTFAQNVSVFGSPMRKDDSVAQNKLSRVSPKYFQLKTNDNEISDDESDSEGKAVSRHVQSDMSNIVKDRIVKVVLSRQMPEFKAKKVASPKVESSQDESDSCDNNEEIDLNTSKSSLASRGRRSLSNSSDLNTSQSGSRTNTRSTNNRKLSSSPVKRTESPDSSQSTNKDNKQVTPSSSKQIGRTRRGKKLSKSPEYDVSHSSLRGQRSKQSLKNIPKKTGGTQKKRVESEDISETESNSSVTRSLRGRSSVKITQSAPRKGSTTDESEAEQKKESSQRGSVTSAKKKLDHSTVSKKYPKSHSSEDTEDLSEAEQNKSRRGKQLPQKAKANSDSDKFVTCPTSARQSLAARGGKRAVQEEIPKQPPSPKKSNLVVSSDSSESEMQRSPKKVTFTECGIDDDLDVYAPDSRISRPNARRKTLLPTLDTIKTLAAAERPTVNRRASSKRKTIGGASDLARISPPKRLKISENKRGVTSSQVENTAGDDLLESDGNYSEWIPLKSIDGKIPTLPAVYEVKVWRAKKTAFIGFAESLRQKLTLHKLHQNSGHKHLDKFIERNMDDIQIRYEVVSSVNDAKCEVKKRVNSFVSQYKTTPAYN